LQNRSNTASQSKLILYRENVVSNFAIIFDSDGVVVDSEPFSLAAFKQAMTEHGIYLSQDDIMANCGLTDAAICDYVLCKFNQKVDIQSFHSRKQQLYEQMISQGELKPCDGIEALLQKLRNARIPYALASSGSRRKIHFNLTLTGLLEKFPIIVSGEEVSRGKPFPDVFLKAAEHLAMPAGSCVVIEDSLNGIEAARRAGMSCVAVAGTFPASALGAADFVVDSLSQLEVENLKKLSIRVN